MTDTKLQIQEIQRPLPGINTKNNHNSAYVIQTTESKVKNVLRKNQRSEQYTYTETRIIADTFSLETM